MVLRRLVVVVSAAAVVASALTAAPVVGVAPAATAEAAQPALVPADPPPVEYHDAVLGDSPSLYYRLNDATAPFVDSSGRGIPGLALPGSGWTANQNGALVNQPTDKAAKFSGRNSSSQTSVNAGLPTGNNARSVEWWAKAPSGDQYKVGWGGFEITLFGAYVDVSGIAYRLPVNTLSDRWHHYVISYDPAQSRLVQVFVDGKLASSGNRPSNLNTSDTPFRVWARTIVANPNSRLDELAVYPSALSQTQAEAHFVASGATRPGGVGGLTASAGPGEISASWTTAASSDTPDSAPGILGYRVTAVDATGNPITSKWVGPAATSATVSGLGAGTFTAKVEAGNGFVGLGEAEVSDAVTSTDGGAYALTVRSHNPRAYYRFGEASTAPWLADSSGRNLDGVDFAPTLLPANTDGALSTDSDTARTFASRNTTYANAGLPDLPSGNAARSTELWIRNNSGGGQVGLGWGGYDLNISAAGSIAGPGFNLSMSQSVMDGAWHHLVVTYEPSVRRFKFYVDSTLIRTHDNASDLTTGADAPLAFLGTSLSSYPNAKLDEVAVYDTTLSPAQIEQHYAASGRARPDAPAGVDATAAAGALDVSWTAVSAPPGQATVGYRAQVLAGSDVVQSKWAPATATAVTLSGLSAGDYTVSVQAMNANGLGDVGSTGTKTVTAGDTNYASTVRADNPSAYYRLGEAPNSRAYADSSGRNVNGSDLILNGKLVPGHSGGIRADADQSALLTGFDPLIASTATSPGFPNGNAARSMDWWMRGTGGPAVFMYGGFDVTVTNSSVTFGATTIPVTRSLLDNNWHHVGVTYDPSAARLITVYVDGQSHATANAAANVTGTDGPFKIRGGSLNSDSDVRLDDVALYPVTLSGSQIQAHFDSGGASRPTMTSVSAEGGNGYVDVNWEATDGATPDGLPGVNGYRVTVLAGAQQIVTRWSPGPATDMTLGGLAPGTYTVTVEPSNSFGRGAVMASDPVTVTSGDADGYASAVKADSPKLFYRLGEQPGAHSFADSSGRAAYGLDLPSGGGLAPGSGGALHADPDGAATLAGWQPATQTLSNAGLPTGDTARSVEWWVNGSTGPWSFTWGTFAVTGNAQSVTVGPNTVGFTRNILDGNWHHVVATYDPSDSRLVTIYVDGESAATGNGSTGLTGTNAAFKIAGAALSSATNVKLDDVAVYDVALTPSQVLTHFNASGNTRPTGVGGVTVNGGTGSIDLGWADHATSNTPFGQAPLTGYRVVAKKGEDNVLTRWVAPADESAALTGLPEGDYTLDITAANGFGFGATTTSPTVTVTGGGSNYQGTVRADSPLSYYRFGESVGAPNLGDSSGRDNPLLDMPSAGLDLGENGGLTGDPDWAAGLTNNDHTSTQAPAGLPNGNTARSVEWWMKSTAGTFSARWGGSIIRASGTTLTLDNDPTTIATATIPNVTDNTWRHVVVTYSPAGRTVNVYVDGTLADTMTATADVAGTNGVFQLGKDGLAFIGKIGELAVYPTVLDLSRVQAHYVAGNPSASTPPGNVRITPRGNGVATVSWERPSALPNGRTPDTYTIKRFRDGVHEQTKVVASDLTRFEVSALERNASYTFTVAAAYGDFLSSSGTTAAFTPTIPEPESAPVSVAVSVAYKGHGITDPEPDPAPCSEGPDSDWNVSSVCGPAYGTGLIAVRNTSERTVSMSISGTYPHPCTAIAASSFLNVAPGKAAVLGGFLRSFDAGASCPGAVATISVTADGESFTFSDGGYLASSPNTKPWTTISGPADGSGELFADATASSLSESGEESCFSLDPIDMYTGAYREHHCLLAVPNRGVPLRFDISHNSKQQAQDGPVGYGWSTGIDATLSRDPAGSPFGVVVRQEDGSQIRFDSPNGSTFTTNSRTYATLTRIPGGFELTRRRQEVLTFNHAGLLTAKKDLNGEGLTYTYNADSRIDTITATSGGTLTFGYQPGSGRIATVTGPLGRSVSMSYDSNGNLQSWVDQAGEMTSYEYNADHLLTQVTTPAEKVTTNTYDTSRRISSQTDPAGNTATLTYGTNTTTSTAAGADGPVSTRYTFSRGVPTSITNAYGTALAQTTQFEYDETTGEKVKVTGPDGRFATATYDDRGNQLTVTDEAGRTTTRTYNALNQVTTETSPAGVTAQYTYNAAGNPTSYKSPKIGGGWHTTTLAYTDPTHPGDVTTLTNPLGGVTTKEYDAIGNVTRVEDETGAVTTATYNAAGQPLTVTNPEGNVPGAIAAEHTVTYNYLTDGRPTGSSDPTGHSTIAVYGTGSRVGATTGPDGTTQAFDYDDLGRVIATHNPDGSTESVTYDDAGNQVGATDSNGHTTTSTYDTLDRLTSTTDAEGRTESYTYDASNRVVAVTRADSTVVTLTYDTADQLTGIDYPGTEADVTYTYNDDGQQTSMTDATGTTTYRINDAGVVDRVTSPVGQVNYGFDADGSNTTTTYPSGRIVTRTANNSGLVTGVNDGAGGDYSFTYGVNEQLETITYPNGVTTTVDRDALGQIGSIDTANAGGSVFTADYALDADSGLAASIDESGHAELDQQFSYNDRDRLTASGASGGVQWDVDDSGNLVTVRGEDQTFDDADRPLTLNTSSGTTTFGYDGRGNRTNATTTAGTTTFAFDTANRMTTGPDGSVFTFTGDGLRASAQSGGSGPVRDWTWDHTTSVPTLLSDGMREYVYGPGGIPLLDAPIHGSTGGAPAMYLHTDSAGSVRFATNAAGDEVWARSFDAYGADAGTWTAAGYAGPMSRIGWQGHYRDDPGMLYVKTRVYDPAAGGFISEDPAVDMTGEAYGYANSNPIAFTDETGTMPSLQDFQAGFGAANERIYSVAGPALAFYQKSSFEASMGVMDSLTFGGFTGWFDIDVNKCSWFYNGGKIGTDVALMLIPGGGAAVGVAKIGLRGAKIANAVSKAGRAGRAISAVGREARTAARVCRNSFTGDTPVRMADGSSKPIRDVKIGDTVLATDPETGETAAEPVTNLIRHAGEHAMVAVTLADGTTINSTAEHPFWETRDQEFTDAEDLKAGDTVLAANGSTVAVARLTPSQADLTAYNLEVADIHTYYAGGATVLTHNACGPKGIHSRLNSGDRGIDIPHVWTNGRLYTQIRDDEVRLVRVLEKGNGKYDVVIREADGSPVTAFRITAKQLADRLKSGRWQ